jgi:hypothetical protein
MQLTPDQVWQVIEKELFAVLGMVTSHGEARTAGVVYVVRDRKLYIVTGKDTWKTRHVTANPHVSITIPIAKRVLIMPWLKIPAATITFSGTARVFPIDDASDELRRALLRGTEQDSDRVANSCIIEVTPEKEFVTYGIGISLMQMRFPEKARGRAPVGE